MSSISIRNLRKVSQVVFVCLIAVLPWIDGFRLDLAEGYFVVVGQKFAVNQLFLLVAAFVFSLLVLALFARTFGRLFCGWLCPQTLWSEFGGTIVTRINKYRKMKLAAQRKTKLLVHIVIRLLVAIPLIWLFYSIIVSYFISPAKMLQWFKEGLPLWFILLGVKFSVIGLIDLVIIRHSFCHSICPYGLLQKFSQKNKVLKVTFRPEQCVDCNLCDLACPMDIYPRGVTRKDSCISCQECIVACGTRAEKYRQKNRQFGTENCLTMTFKPYEVREKEKVDKISIGLIALSSIMLAVIITTIILDNGLSYKITGMSSSDVVTERTDEGKQRFGQKYLIEIDNHHHENKHLVLKVRDQQDQLNFTSSPSEIEINGNSSWKDEIVIFIDTTGVHPGRYIIWIDMYADGEVVKSLKSVFYYQP